MNPWSPSNDLTRIPEVRHNVRHIADACKHHLDGLAREAKALEERKRFIANEDARLRKKVADEAECETHIHLQMPADSMTISCSD